MKVRLGGWGDDPDRLGVKARLFGELVERAEGHLKHYKSDLYHDAHWIREHVNGPMAFWYIVREYGTFIGTDENLLTELFKNQSRNDPSRMWKVKVTDDGGAWYARFVEVCPCPERANQEREG
jgi:hypothetical protein